MDVYHATNAAPWFTSTAVSGMQSDAVGSQLGYDVAFGNFGDAGTPCDEYADLLVSAPLHESHLAERDEGQVFVVLSLGAMGLPVSSIPATADWTGETNQAGALTGWSVAAIDTDCDACDEALVGSPRYDLTSTSRDTGRVDIWLVPGGGSTFTYTGMQAGAQLGYEVANVGDVDANFYADVGVGAPFYDNGNFNEGRGLVLHHSNGPTGSETDCGDGLDNDCDGLIDCLDPDCLGNESTGDGNCDDLCDNDSDGCTDAVDSGCGGTETVCTLGDGVDDDCDGLIDCADDDCDETPEVTCDDGCDNDGDGCIDGVDSDCGGIETVCTFGDGVDDDCDGLLDCDDDDCAESPEVSCADGCDNDGDGCIDAADSDCGGIETTCDVTDLVDDDCDGLLDCADDDCDETPEVSCADGCDNDGDGCIDAADSDCGGTETTCDFGDGTDDDCDGLLDCDDDDCDESPEVSCADGCDNDGDGCIDAADSDCGGTETTCDFGDLIDDDCDGLVDCGDDDCDESPEVSCADGCDNDADGCIDGADSDCGGTETTCDFGDLIDDDCDGLVDCADLVDCDRRVPEVLLR